MEETKGRASDWSPSDPRRSSDRGNETESRSSSEEKRDYDLSPSEPRRRSARRYETESISWEENRETKESSLRISETGPIRDHKGHLQEQIQSTRDVDIQRRRSYETESRSLQHKKRFDSQGTSADWGRRNESKWRFDEGTHTKPQPSEENCSYYIKRGLCSRGSSCRFNHPTHLRGACKYFRRGCIHGSACRFYHSDVEETMNQAREIPDSRERDPRGRFEDINRRRDGTAAGFKRARLEIPLQEQGDGNSESQRREGQENVEEQRLMEIEDQHARDQQIREEEQPRDIARERMEHRMKLDQVKQTVQINESHRAEAELFGRREGDGL